MTLRGWSAATVLSLLSVGGWAAVGGAQPRAASTPPIPAAAADSAQARSLVQVLTHGQQPQDLVMMTVQQGYLLTTANALWSTNDGGRLWQRVSTFPTVLTLTAAGHQIWAQTPQRLWARSLGSAHWTPRPLPPGDTKGWNFNPAQIDFINAADGWLITAMPTAVSGENVELWATHTGGRQWTAIPAQGLPYGYKSFTFLAPQDGWMWGVNDADLGVVQFFQTHTAGLRWSRVRLTLPTAFRHRYDLFTGLHVAGGTDGLLVAANPTPNGGAMWTIYHRTAAHLWEHGAIQTAAAANTNPTVTWTGSTAWVVNGSQLWRGRDGGSHWRLVHHWAGPVWKNPILALAWTGMRPFVAYAIVGNELFLSRNGGTTWRRDFLGGHHPAGRKLP